MIVTILKCNPKMIFPIVSWGIKIVEVTDFSHYAILFDGFVLDSSGHGVRLANLEDFLNRYSVFDTVDIELNCDDYDILLWAKPILLYKYGYIQNFAILLKRLRITDTIIFNGGITCSELVARFLKEFKQELYIPSFNIGLIELEEILSKAKYYVSNS